MRALTLHQPIASALALGLKKFETRSWSTAYRGPICIHAALDSGPERRAAWAAMHADDRAVFAAAGYHFLKALPLMQPVAVAELFDVVPVEAEELTGLPSVERRWGDYRPGRFAWLLRDIRPVTTSWPVAVSGYQGLWHWRYGDLTPHLSAPLRASAPLR